MNIPPPNPSEPYEHDDEPPPAAGYRTYEVYQRERVEEATNAITPRELIGDDMLTAPFDLLGVLREHAPCFRDWVGNRFWVTRYDADELYAAGWFPNQHAGGDGLPKWTRADRAIDNANIVVWHTVNYHHWPRPEDWPVQPVVYAGFHWMPDGFFDENPTMDLPRRK